MSKRKKEQVVVTLGESNDKLYEASKNLAIKMINIEQDPDIVSVFSIARAHGYKVTSTFWQAELEALKAVLVSIDAKRREVAGEPTVVPPAAPAVPAA